MSGLWQIDLTIKTSWPLPVQSSVGAGRALNERTGYGQPEHGNDRRGAKSRATQAGLQYNGVVYEPPIHNPGFLPRGAAVAVNSNRFLHAEKTDAHMSRSPIIGIVACSPDCLPIVSSS